MKRKLFIVAFVFAIAFLFTGCVGSSGGNIVATTSGIYDFYYDNLLKCQSYITEMNSVDFETATDDTYAKGVIRNLVALADDELAIIASVECYNKVSPKEVVLAKSGNDRIFVKQQNGKFNCDIENGGNVTLQYVFEISQDTSSNTYSIKYNKGDVSCKASVVFDQNTSCIQTSITSCENDEKIELRKQFYTLRNNNSAIRINVAIGSSSNRPIYGIDYYREVFKYNAKISSLKAFSGKINIENLSYDKFITTLSNDNCGYKISSKDGTNAEVTKFGDLANW